MASSKSSGNRERRGRVLQRQPFQPIDAQRVRLTLPVRRKYNFVSANYCFGGRNGNIYHISSALFKTEKDARFSDADEHQGGQKGLEA